MYAPEFDYYRAGSVSEAAGLLRKHPGAKLLAGGQSLIPLLKLRLAAPAAVIDIGRIRDLKGITVKDSTIRIGAMTTHAELAASAELAETCHALAQAAAGIGDPAVRNRGTIGGNIAHADPASDLPTVLVALEARLMAEGPDGKRTLGAGGFFQGLMTTALKEHEILTAIEIPAHSKGQGSAYAKFAHPASRYAVIGVAAIITASGGKCSAARVAVGGMVPRPVRASSVERAITGQELSAENIAKAASQVTENLGNDLLGDIFASEQYRRSVASVWVKRALTQAATRAK
jgi:aerobic carbon-monoxide dehydrogenase medium subunit